MKDPRLLESWKDIAAYLGRSVRACARWEAELGLPVHRLDGAPKARVFAYKDEIDRWLEEKLHERAESPDRMIFQHAPAGKRFGTVAWLALVGVGVALPSVWLVNRQAKIHWAKTVALPEIRELVAKDDDIGAFKLLREAEKHIREDPDCISLGSQIKGDVTVQTTPPGAQVFIRDYRDVSGEWEFLGRSPLEGLKVRRGSKRWKIVLPGYETVEGMFYVEGAKSIPYRVDPAVIKIALDKIGTIPPGMARIHGALFRPTVERPTALPELQLGDYLLDRYEVTNRQFKEFVDAGGYGKPDYWDHPFVLNGRELAWGAGVKLFVDKTGRPGPAAWELGNYPAGQDDLPVTGVSWYEADAYAKFAKKSLPTIYHWCFALEDPALAPIELLSNIGGNGPAPAGQYQGISSWGIYDMVGNVREWGLNEVPPERRLVIGNSWHDNEYNTWRAEGYSPFLRDPDVGFRCMKTLGQAEAPLAASAPVSFLVKAESAASLTPCSDEVFRAYKALYHYRKTDVRAETDYAEDLTEYTRLEKASFDAAYGDERMSAYLFIPRMGPPPYQTIIYFPGDGAWFVQSIFDYASKDGADRFTKNGRAFVFPVLRGMFDRKVPPEKLAKTTELEQHVMWVKDFMRTIDYLETRTEFDAHKIAYEGLSRGGVFGSIIPAIDGRIKAAVLLSAGLYVYLPPEFGQVNFAPRVNIPVLMQNGKFDYGFSVETVQKPLFRLLGTPEKDKYHKIYDASHYIWLKSEYLKDEQDFLDKYLGPVKRY